MKGHWIILFSRIAEEEESARVSIEEEIQKELRFLGLREEDTFLDKKDGEKAMVLLVRNHSGVSEHVLSGRRTLRSTQMADRLSPHGRVRLSGIVHF